MKICSTVHILEKRLGSIERALDMLKEANFDLADLSLFFMKLGKEHRFSGDNYKEEAIKLGEYAKSIGIPFYQAHAPFEFDFKRHDLETEIIPTVYRSIEVAALAGCSCIVVHPLQHYGYFGSEEELFADNMKYYANFVPLCEQYGIKICVENMWKRHPYRKCIDHSVCSRPAEFNRYVDTLNETHPGNHFIACLDLGHTVLVGEEPCAMIRAMGSRIGALHVHDNNYHDDSHTIPGLGLMDHPAICAALKEVGYSGVYTLEADSFIIGLPDELMQTALNFMYTVSRHFADLID